MEILSLYSKYSSRENYVTVLIGSEHLMMLPANGIINPKPETGTSVLDVVFRHCCRILQRFLFLYTVFIWP